MEARGSKTFQTLQVDHPLKAAPLVNFANLGRRDVVNKNDDDDNVDDVIVSFPIMSQKSSLTCGNSQIVDETFGISDSMI